MQENTEFDMQVVFKSERNTSRGKVHFLPSKSAFELESQEHVTCQDENGDGFVLYPNRSGPAPSLNVRSRRSSSAATAEEWRW